MDNKIEEYKKAYIKGGYDELYKALSNDECLTLSEIAYIFDITRERVRQIEVSAIKKIKNPKIGRKLRRYLRG